MEIVSSNRLEVLYEHFLESVEFKPFEPITVVVPSSALREWLTYRLAKDKGVAFGIEILLLHEALLKSVKGKAPPSMLALSFAIEAELDGIEEIKEYLKSDKRQHALSCRLAQLFQKYSSNCPRMKKEWRLGWQAKLYKKIFENRSALWDAVEPSSFYLFGISYLSPIEKKAFQSSKVWLFSPCLEYWEDQLSEKTQAQLLRSFEKRGVKERSLEDFEKTLDPIHPLLAEWGALGKPMTLLDEHEKSLYMAPLKVVETWDEEGGEVFLYDGEVSQLDYLKAEVLYGRKSETNLNDDSIAFYQFSTEKKEAEGLRHQLISLLQKGIEPKDILILTPVLDKMKGLLPLAFKEDIPFFICDEGEVQGDDKRFITLWESIQSGSPIHEMMEWIQAAHLFDVETLRKIKSRFQGSENFWDKAFENLRNDIVQGEIDSTDIEPLRQFVVFYQKLKPLLNIGEKKSLRAWCELFNASLEWVNSSTAREVIAKIAQVNEKGLYSFYTVFEHLKNGIALIQKEPIALNLNSIRVSSLYPMRLVPARAIILVGMSEDNYPRKEFVEPLDQSKEFEEEPIPSKRELDLYLLLETLFQAQEHFWITYSNELSRPLLILKDILNAKEIYSNASRLYQGPATFSPPLTFKAFKKERENILLLDEMTRAIGSPIKAYFKKCLKVDLIRPEEDQEILVPNGLDQYLLKKSIAEMGQFRLSVQGRFTEALIEKKAEEIAPFAGISIPLDPPLEIDGVRIYGTLKPVSEKGVHIIKGGIPSRYDNLLPIYIWGYIHNQSAKYRQLGKKDSEFITSPLEALRRLIEYYYQIHEEFCPLESDWINTIASGDVAKLHEQFQKAEDPYQALAIARGLNSKEVIAKWQETAIELASLIKEVK